MNNAANAGHQVHRRGDSNDASRCADDVHHVIGSAPGANSVPMRVERSYWDRNPCLQPQLFSPERRERTGDLIGRSVFAIQFLADSLQQRINLYQKALRGKATQLSIP